MGTTGTGADIPSHQAESFLIKKEYVLSPLPMTEKYLNLIDMKQWQCCIIQISDKQGEPFDDPIVYSLFFNDITVISDWCATGEPNDNGIFHVHAMLKTGTRSDALRRSMQTAWHKLTSTTHYMKRVTAQASLDCLKLQRCHKPSSMMQYMTKNPYWCLANSDNLLQAMYDIELHALNERFKKTEDDPTQSTSVEINAMSKELIDIIVAGNCKTFEDCLRTNPEGMSKYLHRPGLNAVVSNCLAFVKSTGGAWSLHLFEKYDPNPEPIHRVLLHQGISPSLFDQTFHAWLTKSDTKKNTLMLQGPSNTGKSAFIAGLKQNVPWGEIVNTSNFQYEGLIDCVVGIWEEPLCSSEQAEKAKQVLEGMQTLIPVKYKKPFLLPRTPILITSNHPLWRYCIQEEVMFRNRMWIFEFEHISKDSLYLPRTSECSCKCRYCTASRGGSPTHGESSPCEVQREKSTFPDGGSTVGSYSSSDVDTRSVRSSGTDTSSSYNSTSGCSDPSTTELGSDGTGCPGRTCTAVIRDIHLSHISTGSSNTNNGRHSPRPSTSKYVEPRLTTGNDGSDNGRDGSGGTDRYGLAGTRGGVRVVISEHGSVSQLGRLGKTKASTQAVSLHTKKRKLDKSLGARVGAIKLNMTVPSSQDWKEYLSYIYHYYG